MRWKNKCLLPWIDELALSTSVSWPIWRSLGDHGSLATLRIAKMFGDWNWGVGDRLGSAAHLPCGAALHFPPWLGRLPRGH